MMKAMSQWCLHSIMAVVLIRLPPKQKLRQWTLEGDLRGTTDRIREEEKAHEECFSDLPFQSSILLRTSEPQREMPLELPLWGMAGEGNYPPCSWPIGWEDLNSPAFGTGFSQVWVNSRSFRTKPSGKKRDKGSRFRPENCPQLHLKSQVLPGDVGWGPESSSYSSMWVQDSLCSTPRYTYYF